MAEEELSFLERCRDFLEGLFALKITDAERFQYAGDPQNPFHGEVFQAQALQVAAVLSALFHILLFIIVFPSFGDRVLILTQEVLVLKQLAEPAALAGGGSTPEVIPPEPKPTVPEPKPDLIPIPDPTPNAPEPILKKEIEEIPQVLAEIASDLNIGDIEAPPGPPARGSGRGPVDGTGPGTGDGGIYTIGGGVTMPRFCSRPLRATQMTPSNRKSRGSSFFRLSFERTERWIASRCSEAWVTAWKRKRFKKLPPIGDSDLVPSREGQWMSWLPSKSNSLCARNSHFPTENFFFC